MSVILRKPLIALAVASLLISLGCLITGLLLGDGALNALGCLFSGVTEYSDQKHQAFQFKPASHSDSNPPPIPV